VTGRGRQFESKRHFLQFFNNNSKTNNYPSPIFYYVVDTTDPDKFLFYSNFLTRGLHGHIWLRSAVGVEVFYQGKVRFFCNHVYKNEFVSSFVSAYFQ